MIISSDPFFLVVVAAGGPASIVANVIIGALAETEVGQAVLARIQEKKETLGSYIGAAASGLENVDEFTEALGDEQREKNSDFYGSMQGGGDAVTDFLTILGGAKRINKKSGVGDSDSGESNTSYTAGSHKETSKPKGDGIPIRNSYLDKPKQKVNSAGPGDVVRTPDNFEDDFIKLRGGDRKNKYTGEIWSVAVQNGRLALVVIR